MREAVLLLYLFAHIAAMGFMPLVTWRTARNMAWIGTHTLLTWVGFGISCFMVVWLLRADIDKLDEHIVTLFVIEILVAGLAGLVITSVAVAQSAHARKQQVG